jgi:hypothetical protein
MKERVLEAVVTSEFTMKESFQNFLDGQKLTDQEKIELRANLEGMGWSLDLFPKDYFPRQVEQARAEPARSKEKFCRLLMP